MIERAQTTTLAEEAEAHIADYEERYDEPGPYLVVRSAFHGGGVVSCHRSLKAAGLASARCSRGGCACRCSGIVPEARYDELPYASDARSAFELAR